MGTTLLLKTKHGIADTKPIILEVLKDHSDFSYAQFLKFESECNEFEKKYKMDSEIFLNKFDSGELGDDLQWFDWYASIRGKNLWGKKYQILSEISWNE
jgi:hypothetical protein